MRKDIKFILIVLLLGALVILLYNPDYEKRCWKLLDIEKYDNLNGVVVSKYYEKGNMYPFLEIRQFSDSTIVKKSFHSEFSGIYDSTNIGDTIWKKNGSLIYHIQRDTLVLEIKYTNFCNQ